jgi:hypothetical protein
MTSADHAAWVAARATIWAAVFTGVSAGGVLWGAWIARSAARTWRGVHEHAKADECIAAAFDLTHAIGRVIDERRRLQDTPRAPATPAPFPGEAYDEAWVAWRRLQLAYAVAFRYHAVCMDRAAPDRLAKVLDDLKTWCSAAPRDTSNFGMQVDRALFAVDESRAEDIKRRALNEAEAIDAALMPARSNG